VKIAAVALICCLNQMWGNGRAGGGMAMDARGPTWPSWRWLEWGFAMNHAGGEAHGN